jgi:hypothetical protein
MILKKTDQILKTFSFSVLPIQNFFLGKIPENSYAYRIDISSTLNSGILSIKTAEKDILKDVDVNSTFISTVVDIASNNDLYVSLLGTPTQGDIDIIIYYILNSSIHTLSFSKIDFNKNFLLVNSLTKRLYDIRVFIDEIFDDGILFIGTEEEKDKVLKINLTESDVKLRVESDTTNELKLFLEGFPTKGSGKLIIIYFDL